MHPIRIAMILSLVLLACGDSAESFKPVKRDGTSTAEDLLIEDADGNAILSLTNSGSRITAVLTTRSDRRTFTMNTGTPNMKIREDGTNIAEIKVQEYGFKVYNADDNLRYKVKYYADEEKVKISTDEEGSNPFQIYYRDSQTSNRMKVKFHENEVGSIKYYPDTGKTKVKDRYDREICVNAQEHFSIMYGLMLSDIPENYRTFIMMQMYHNGE